MGDLVKGMVEPLAKRWTATMGGPLLLFWMAGALTVLHRFGPPSELCGRTGALGRPVCRIAGQGAWGTALLAAALTAGLVLSAVALSAVASPALEVLAGRWGTSAPAVALAHRRTARHASRRERLGRRAADRSGPGAHQGDRLIAWRAQNAWRRTGAGRAWSHYPRRRDELRPTTVGNALHGVAAGIERNYGLSLPVCWGPFVECLEATARERLTASATRVLGRTQALVCAVLAPVWTLLLEGVAARVVWLVVCALWVWGAHRALRSGTEQYCEHVRDVFAVHRIRLYRAAGFPAPVSTEAEVASGNALSEALAMELTRDTLFAWPDAP
ncbi:hypothetical protein [Streptomyces sp. NBC_01104]|uniref:hypothetical protein n=1 Tax=Streptomyces sp. NBC_01104 TaxID=2903750 RepID=UPI00386A30E6|nr:hypothetical protein OG450_07070 [Streptomyces sp. NBC_01104]